MSTRREADALVEFVAQYFLNQSPPTTTTAAAAAAARPASDGAADSCAAAGGDGVALGAYVSCCAAVGAVAGASRAVEGDGRPAGVASAGVEGGARGALPRAEGVNGCVPGVDGAESGGQRAVEAGVLEGAAADGAVEEVRAQEGEVTEIFVYPIKSCGAHACGGSWPLTARGLLYDRLWTLVDVEGSALTQKNEPELARIHPELVLGAGDTGGDVLRVTCAGRRELGCLEIAADKLPEGEGGGGGRLRGFLSACSIQLRWGGPLKSVQVCGRKDQGLAYGAAVNQWFTAALGRECMLIRQAGPAGGQGAVAGAGSTGAKTSRPGTPPSGPVSSSSEASSSFASGALQAAEAGGRAEVVGSGGGMGGGEGGHVSFEWRAALNGDGREYRWAVAPPV